MKKIVLGQLLCRKKIRTAPKKYGVHVLGILRVGKFWQDVLISYFFRFLPDGTYLNAKEYTPLELADKMNEIIHDKQMYYDFFKFHRYYTYHAVAESVDTDPLCAFCAYINDEPRRNERRTYAQFTKWWHRSDEKKNETHFIERYENSGPHIKAIITYRYKYVQKEEIVTPSAIESVGSFVDDVINYYFPNK